MSLYNVILSAHIFAGVVLVGGSILATPAIDGWIRRADSISDIRRWLTVGRPLATINPISAIVLLATGVYLTAAGHWWEFGWLRVALTLWVINAALANTVIKSTMGRLAQLAFDQPSIGPELDAARRSTLWVVATDVMLANDLAVLYLMTAKGGYVASIAVVVAAHAAISLYRMIRRPAGKGSVAALPPSHDESISASPAS